MSPEATLNRTIKIYPLSNYDFGEKEGVTDRDKTQQVSIPRILQENLKISKFA